MATATMKPSSNYTAVNFIQKKAKITFQRLDESGFFVSGADAEKTAALLNANGVSVQFRQERNGFNYKPDGNTEYNLVENALFDRALQSHNRLQR